MIYRDAFASDFEDIENFVFSSIYPAFDHPDLSHQQRLENEWIIKISRESCMEALVNERKKIVVAIDQDKIAGFVIAYKTSENYSEIDWLMVTVAYHGKGVGDELMTHALCWMGDQADVKLGVIYYNERAIRFYEKFGFKDTGKIVGNHKIPRKLLIKPGRQT